MAAYAAAATLVGTRSALRLQHSRIGVLFGTVNVTNYNSTLVEITDITGHFRADPIVVLGGLSDSGYAGEWIDATQSIKCWYPSKAQTHDHDFFVSGGEAAATTARIATYATNILGKEAATDITVAGADSATKGGVLSETLAAAAGTEVANDVDVGAFKFFAIGLGR